MKRKFLKIKVNCIVDFPLTIIDGSTLLMYEKEKNICIEIVISPKYLSFCST